MPVEVVWSGIRRRLREVPDAAVVVVKASGVKGAPADLMTDIDRARLQANEALAHPDGSEVTGAASPAVAIPKGVIVTLDSVEDEGDVQHWLDLFADHLSRCGRSGKVSTAPITWPSPELDQLWFSGNAVNTAAFLGYSLAPWTPPVPANTVRWMVPPDATRRIAENMLSWEAITEAGRELYGMLDVYSFRLDEPFPAETIAAFLARDPQAGVLYLSKSYDRYVQSGADWYGGVAHCLYDAHLTWQQRLEPARGLLIDNAGDLDIGFARVHPAPTTGWLSLAAAQPRLLSTEGEWRYNRPLWPRLVPDAHGIQVLTPAHLDRAHDLGQWDTTRLDDGHYLVQARDLEPWFAGHTPEPDVVEAARTDFGEMIMTPETIAADPDGRWPESGRPYLLLV